jgi:hypothetical protein
MLGQMRAREEAAWFENPVSLGDVPDYLTVISQPMDYSTMGKKLAEGEYSADLLSFASDMRLIFRNALAYNWDPENECHQAAKQVHPAPLAPTAGVVSPVAHPPPRTRHVPCTSPTIVSHCDVGALCGPGEAAHLVLARGSVLEAYTLREEPAPSARGATAMRRAVLDGVGAAKLERKGWDDISRKSIEPEPALARTIGDHPIAVSHSFKDELLFNVRGIKSYAKSLIAGPSPITMDMRRKSWANR